ncbi:general transcription factor II-I repeat domain-containing protein 2A [Trichonephila clavipes]|nr:general transcription factor II-I repeat domain-containing protein 2A [Trichonephila clavipes]
MLKYVSKNCHTSAASYSAANAIARHGKPFQEGEFLKEAWLACAPSLFDDFDNKDKIIQRIKDVPLSRNTMKDRILKLVENVTDQQKSDINSAPFISLCLDESIDITKSARLAVFARYCVGNIIKEELIAIYNSVVNDYKGHIYLFVRQLESVPWISSSVYTTVGLVPTIGYNFQAPPNFGLRCPVLLRPIAALSKSS